MKRHIKTLCAQVGGEAATLEDLRASIREEHGEQAQRYLQLFASKKAKKSYDSIWLLLKRVSCLQLLNLKYQQQFAERAGNQIGG